MIEFRRWLFGLMAAAVVIAVANSLLPKGTVRSVTRCISGLTLLAVLLHPFRQGSWSDFSREYRRAEEETAALTRQYRQESYEEMKKIIEDKLSAYILDKAALLGLTGEVVVSTAERDGVPYPVSVRLSVPYHQTLSQYITQELGIAGEMQFWEEEA